MWICNKPECKGHKHCLKQPAQDAPRVRRVLDVVDENTQERAKSYCICHNCDQVRRQRIKRQPKGNE